MALTLAVAADIPGARVPAMLCRDVLTSRSITLVSNGTLIGDSERESGQIAPATFPVHAKARKRLFQLQRLGGVPVQSTNKMPHSTLRSSSRLRPG